MNAQEILRELVAIPTPSHQSNLPLIEWVAHFLEAKGWQVQLFPYSDEQSVAKANLLARPSGAMQDEAQIELAFVCHTDTVPFSGAWRGATLLTSSADGKLLHGCGSCDVKGALACFLAAIEDTIVSPQVALILSADEEVGCKGMDRLLRSAKLQISSAIVSEPTSLRPGIAGKGYGLARITINGIEAHSAYPNEGVSAIAMAAKLICQINELGAQVKGEHGDVLFDPPRTTINVGVIEGGSAKNIVAGKCSFLVEWRPIPSDPPRAILAQLEWLCDCLRSDHPKVHVHIELLRAEAGFGTAEPGPLQLRLRQMAVAAGQPFRPCGISFGSEATRLSAVAQEVIVIGPGDMHTAHSDRECVPVAELETWTAALRALLSTT
jgi:acetylornithine deacetylase